MAERKTGPVKPPVIDLTARPAAPADQSKTAPAETAAAASPSTPATSSAAEAKTPADNGASSTPPDRQPPTEAKAQEAKAPEPTAPRQRRASPWGPAIGGAIAGAALATAICYGLAYEGLWPSGSADLAAGMEQLDGRLGATEQTSARTVAALADLNTRLGGIESDVTARLATSSAALDGIKADVGNLTAAPAKTVDLAPLEAQIRTLSARLDAVAAGASSADAGALAANLAALEKSVGDLAGKVAAADARAGAAETALGGLKTDLDAVSSRVAAAVKAPSAATIASAMQLPLILSGLEADFAAGRPYAGDLKNLLAAVPDAKIPAAVADAAASGLPQPEALVQQFEAALPDILAARPITADADWQAQVGDWLKAVLALRPAGELPGDSPEALTSRLEGAVKRHDFAAAATLLGQLPPPMRAAAGDAGDKIAALAAADALVGSLRAAALAQTGEAK
jgi:hypothetical protein